MSTVAADHWKLLLSDFVAELIQDVQAAKAAATAENDSFELGRRMAYYDLLDRLRQQVNAFGLDASEIGLKDVDLEREFFSR